MSEKNQVVTIDMDGIGTLERMLGREMSDYKEQIDAYTLVVCVDDQIIAPVEACIYQSRSRNASVVYASVWLRYDGFFCSGHGRATGGGYHKASAAVQSALDSAGVTLSRPIDGCGHVAIIDAIEAIGAAMGLDGYPMRVI